MGLGLFLPCNCFQDKFRNLLANHNAAGLTSSESSALVVSMATVQHYGANWKFVVPFVHSRSTMKFLHRETHKDGWKVKETDACWSSVYSEDSHSSLPWSKQSFSSFGGWCECTHLEIIKKIVNGTEMLICVFPAKSHKVLHHKEWIGPKIKATEENKSVNRKNKVLKMSSWNADSYTDTWSNMSLAASTKKVSTGYKDPGRV